MRVQVPRLWSDIEVRARFVIALACTCAAAALELEVLTLAPLPDLGMPAWNADTPDLALGAHRLFRTRIVIGWDVALRTDGPMMIEGNSNMDVSFIQRAYREPIGRGRLGALLACHLAHRQPPAAAVQVPSADRHAIRKAPEQVAARDEPF
jgi:hypothetical protein